MGVRLLNSWRNQHMYRVRRKGKQWMNRWPWRWVFPKLIDERYCSGCGLPYQNGPMPREEASYTSHSVCAIRYPAGGFRKHESVFKIGRWKGGGTGFYFSEFIPMDDLDDVLLVLCELKDARNLENKTPQKLEFRPSRY